VSSLCPVSFFGHYSPLVPNAGHITGSHRTDLICFGEYFVHIQISLHEDWKLFTRKPVLRLIIGLYEVLWPFYSTVSWVLNAYSYSIRRYWWFERFFIISYLLYVPGCWYMKVDGDGGRTFRPWPLTFLAPKCFFSLMAFSFCFQLMGIGTCAGKIFYLIWLTSERVHKYRMAQKSKPLSSVIIKSY